MLSYFNKIRHYFWLAPVFLGVVFIGSGIYMVSEGRSAHNDVRDSVVREDITVSEDAAGFGGETIDSAAKAQAQSDAILGHTLAATGGYLYAQLGQFQLPEGTYVLPNGTYMTADGDATQDVALAATDDNGNPIITTTDETLAAKNSSDQPVRAWTSDRALAATDDSGNPVANPLRTTALNSANLRTSLGVAVMGFKVSDLVVGLGAFMIVIGATSILFMAPAVYYAADVANEHAKAAKEPKKATSTTPPATA